MKRNKQTTRAAQDNCKERVYDATVFKDNVLKTKGMQNHQEQRRNARGRSTKEYVYRLDKYAACLKKVDN